MPKKTIKPEQLQTPIKNYKTLRMVYVPLFNRIYIYKNNESVANFPNPRGFEDAKKEFNKQKSLMIQEEKKKRHHKKSKGGNNNHAKTK